MHAELYFTKTLESGTSPKCDLLNIDKIDVRFEYLILLSILSEFIILSY